MATFNFQVINHGDRNPGRHFVEFSIPEGTVAVLGQVQESTNFGDAHFVTNGIAIRPDPGPAMRCRVDFEVQWGVDSPLPCIGRYIIVS